MPIYPFIFLFIVFFGNLAAIFVGPIYGLILYYFIYFNIPEHQWWGFYIPRLKWSYIAIIALFISSIIHTKKINKIKNLTTAPFKSLLLFLLLTLTTLPFSYSYSTSIIKFEMLLKYTVIYFFTVLVINSTRDIKIILYFFIFAFLNLSLLANFYFDGTRLDGVGLSDANDANLLAALILLIFPPLIQLFIHGIKYEKIISAITIIPVLNTFMMCGSRGGFIGLVVSLTTLSLLQTTKKNIFKIFGGGILFFVLFFNLISSEYQDRLFSLNNSVKQGDVEESSAGRIAIWKNSIKILEDYPFGTGGGGFMELSPLYLPSDLLDNQQGKRACHNTYLLLLIEQGPIGLLLYLSFILTTFYSLFRGKTLIEEIRNQRSQDEAQENAFLHAQIIGFISALSGFWTASFFIDRVYFEAIYIFSALGVAISFIVNRSNSTTA